MKFSEMDTVQFNSHTDKVAHTIKTMMPSDGHFVLIVLKADTGETSVSSSLEMPVALASIEFLLKAVRESRAAYYPDASKPESRRTGTREAIDPEECFGKGKGGGGKCCDNVGLYNGYGSDGPLSFTCPKGCSCHD